jgi:DNA mismatch repair ATPase MutS
VLTCIQVLDSIRLHLSHFYGEVKQIKRILDSVSEPDALPVLYLIDEIFSGTNTKERLLASRGIIQKLAASRSFGLVTTHDLELVTLAEASDRVKNYHFRDDIDEKGNMVFHYRLHPGPIRSTNALEILKREGIEF